MSIRYRTKRNQSSTHRFPTKNTSLLGIIKGLGWLDKARTKASSAHDVGMTLHERCFDVLTSHQRPYNVVLTSCPSWEHGKNKKNGKVKEHRNLPLVVRRCKDDNH